MCDVTVDLMLVVVDPPEGSSADPPCPPAIMALYGQLNYLEQYTRDQVCILKPRLDYALNGQYATSPNCALLYYGLDTTQQQDCEFRGLSRVPPMFFCFVIQLTDASGRMAVRLCHTRSKWPRPFLSVRSIMDVEVY
jgi:hypothetical protein